MREGAKLAAHLAAADVFVFPEPDRHVRRRAARGARLRRAGRGLSGHGSEGRGRRTPGRRARRRSARGLPRRRCSMSREACRAFALDAFLGEQRPAVHRAHDCVVRGRHRQAIRRMAGRRSATRSLACTADASTKACCAADDQRSRRSMAAADGAASSTRTPIDQGLRELGAGLRSGVRRGVRARPAGRDRGGRAHRRPHPRSRRRHRHLAAGLFGRRTALSASTFPSRCCARRRSASPSSACTNVEGLAVMDAEHLDFPDDSFDVVVAQYVDHRGAQSGSDARRVRPRAQAGRRDRAGQPGRRRSGPAALAGAVVRAGGAQARLAHRILLGALSRAGRRGTHGMRTGRAPRRCRRSAISR